MVLLSLDFSRRPHGANIQRGLSTLYYLFEKYTKLSKKTTNQNDASILSHRKIIRDLICGDGIFCTESLEASLNAKKSEIFTKMCRDVLLPDAMKESGGNEKKFQILCDFITAGSGWDFIFKKEDSWSPFFDTVKETECFANILSQSIGQYIATHSDKSSIFKRLVETPVMIYSLQALQDCETSVKFAHLQDDEEHFFLLNHACERKDLSENNLELCQYLYHRLEPGMIDGRRRNRDNICASASNKEFLRICASAFRPQF